jgi:beta-1,4-N-acetylglucosaminyltransferase
MKLIIVLGEGGHSYELLKLIGFLRNSYDYHYVISRDDNLSANWIQCPGAICRVIRPRGRHTGVLHAMFRTTLSGIQSAWILLRVRPDAILSAGPAIAVPMSVIGKLFGVQIIFVESACRFSSLSLTGRMMYRLADLFFVQWPQLAGRLPRAIYAGRLV